MVESNLISTILVAQQTVRLIGEKGGVLANVLSSAAQVGKANESLYCASKWGMRGFLESLRAELKGSQLRLVNLYPSGIRSEFWDNSDHVDPERFYDPGRCGGLYARRAGSQKQLPRDQSLYRS